MTRRKFVKIILGTTLLVVGSWPFIKDFNEIARRIIEKDISKLKVGKDVLDEFSKDIKKVKGWDQFSAFKKILIRIHFYFDPMLFRLPYYHKYLHYKNIMMETFLLSTDFVVHHMDQNREIKYLGLFDPYKRYCFNPFSSSFYKV